MSKYKTTIELKNELDELRKECEECDWNECSRCATKERIDDIEDMFFDDGAYELSQRKREQAYLESL